ncbi:AAA family ATPase [Nocardia sp. NPDC004068]|uniref:AAA family ATPase n=1 Tax=Nocardia sp. NPDC004068 TaxID=3364303 RepID=UPI0036B0F2F2
MNGHSKSALIVLRGNSGSGKSTVAHQLQRHFPKGQCAVVAQDTVRRTILRERDETARHHETRPQSTEFTSSDMRSWYHGWQPLPFVAERRIDASWSVRDTVERVCSDLRLGHAL